MGLHRSGCLSKALAWLLLGTSIAALPPTIDSPNRTRILEPDKLCSDTGQPPKALDLAKWHLQVPDGTKGMKTISSPSSHHDEYFGGSDAGVIFCAPGNGGTSGHSEDPRSELEDQQGVSPIKKGNVRTLQAKVKVLHLSPSSQAKVVVGQIHNKGSEAGGSGLCNELNQLLKLHVKKNGDVEAEVKDAKGKGLPLKITNIKDDDWTLTYKIELKFDQLTVTGNGKPVSYDYSKVLSKCSKAFKTPYCFKAGDYCDPGEDKYRTASEGCKVEFFSLAASFDSSSGLANTTNIMV